MGQVLQDTPHTKNIKQGIALHGLSAILFAPDSLHWVLYLCMDINQLEQQGKMVAMNKYKLPISLWWIVILLCITGCNSEQMIDYYCEKDNYISATGVVTHITYSNSMDQIYIAFEEMVRFFPTILKLLSAKE